MENHDRPTRRVRRVRTSSTGPCVAGDGTAAAALSVRELPVLPVRNAVLLPNMVVPLFVDDEPALRAVEDALAHDKTPGAQRTRRLAIPAGGRVPDWDRVRDQSGARGADDVTSLVVQGLRRFRIDAWLQQAPDGRVRGVAFDEPHAVDERIEAYARVVLGGFETVARTSSKLNEDTYIQALNIERPGALADFVASQIELPVAERQKVLEAGRGGRPLADRLRARPPRGAHALELEHQIQTEVQRELDRGQREEYLRRQIQVIQRELADHDPALREPLDLKIGSKRRDCPRGPERAQRELERLDTLPPMAPEYQCCAATSIGCWLALATATRIGTISRGAPGARREPLRAGEDQRSHPRVHRGAQARAGVGHQYCASSVRQASARLRSAGPSPRRWDASSCASRWAACMTKPRFADTAARTSARMPGRILQTMKTGRHDQSGLRARRDRQARVRLSGRPSSALLEVLDPEQNTPSPITTWKCHTISRRSSSSSPRTCSIPFPRRCSTAWRSSRYRATPRRKAAYRPPITSAAPAARQRPQSARFEIDEGPSAGSCASIPSRPACATSSARWRRSCAEWRGAWPKASAARRPSRRKSPRISRTAEAFPHEAEDSDQIGVAIGLAWTAAGGELTPVEMAVLGRGKLSSPASSVT